MIRLDPMSAAEFAEFIGRTIPGYAESTVRAGRYRPEEALARSRADFDRLLPQGLETPGQTLRVLRDPTTRERVGELWFGREESGAKPQLFVYWIGIDEKFRRKHYASEAFAELEHEARRQGLDRIGLHVFGENRGARALYLRLGFVETNVVMHKAVGPA